jgi:Uma2 family endonuclease
MATAQTPPQTQTPALEPLAFFDPLWRMSVDQYHAMIEADILDEDAPIELVEGVLLQKMSKNPGHTYSTNSTRKAFELLLGDAWYVNSQEPITLSDSEPEPDVMIVAGDRRAYRNRHPGPNEVRLVVEVAEASIGRDRGVKLRMYARAGIPEYWIIDLNSNRVEVRTLPAGDDYLNVAIYTTSDSIPVTLGGTVLGQIAASSLLPA